MTTTTERLDRTGERLVLAAPAGPDQVGNDKSHLELMPGIAAAQRFAFLGSSGSGKSYGCGRYVEQLAAARVPVLVVDTVGIWPALRLAADGKGKGLPFTIIGGEHEDVPLDLSKGAELARFLVAHDASAVIDLSDHEPTPERALFVAEFCRALLVAVKAHRRPRVVVFDEAQDLVPQVAQKGEAAMKAAVGALVRKGRNHLCGTVLVTQRPQDVSKTAFDQVGNLFVGALFAKRARDAVRDWAGSKARTTEVDAQIADLPSLQPGEFFFWSPQWLTVYRRIRFLPKWTYDGSSSTSTQLAYRELSNLAPLDVQALRALLAPPKPSKKLNGAPVLDVAGETVGVVYGDDPGKLEAAEHNLRELEGRINELLDERNQARDALKDATTHLETARAAAHHLEAALIRLATAHGEAQKAHGELVAALDFTPPALPGASASGNPVPQRTVRSSVSASPRENAGAKEPPHVRRTSDPGERKPSGGTRKAEAPGTADGAAASYSDHLLAAIVRFGPVSRLQIALVSGHNPTSSQMGRVLARFKVEGLAVQNGGRYEATALGQKQATEPRFLRGERLRIWWAGQFSDYQGKIFDALVPDKGSRAYPTLSRAELANVADVNGTSSQYGRVLARFVRNGMFHREGGHYSFSAEARWAFGS